MIINSKQYPVKTCIRFTIGYIVKIIFLILGSSLYFHTALAEQGVAPAHYRQQALNLNIAPTFKFEKAAHVAGGVALRNRTSGTIHLRGMRYIMGNSMTHSKIVKAFLYWNFSDKNIYGSPQRSALFNGNVVVGDKIADNPDPGWDLALGMVGNHTYRADVTPIVLEEKTNQDYKIVIAFNQKTLTSGQNPWAPLEAQEILAEGATLIVVYTNPALNSKVYLYDDLSGSTFAFDATFILQHSGLGRVPSNGLFTMTGADGQRGFDGYDNNVSNEKTFFNSFQIAGPPVAASDWDGSAGWPLPQLWDVHTHRVKFFPNQSKVVYEGVGDYVVPVAFALEFF